MADTNIPGLSIPTTPPNGLINASAPPVTGVPTPAQQVQAAPAATTPPTTTAVNYTPQAFKVTPEQTVSGQIKNIIASGSPLMQQAETHAKNLMQQRGLINSSMAVGAAQGAVIGAAAPIATADAATYAKAASDTTTAQNAALAAGVTATNAASTVNAQIAASTNLAEIQSSTSQEIAKLQSDTTLTAQDKQNQGQEIIADIKSNTTLTAQEKQNLSNQVIAQLQSSTSLQINTANITSAKDLQTMQGQVQQQIANIQANTQLSVQDKQNETAKIIAAIQANTQLSVQDKAIAGQAALAVVNNAANQRLAQIQADTSLSIADKQTQSAQVIAGLNNANALAVQNLVNAGNLATIQANGVINLEITNLTNTNKLLLQTSTAASSVYSQTLANMATIMTNPNLDADQKATALNNGVAALSDALRVINGIANNQAVSTTLDFTPGAGTSGDHSQILQTLPPDAPAPIVTPPPAPPRSAPAQTPAPAPTPSAPTGPLQTSVDVNNTIGQFNTALQSSGSNIEDFVKSSAAVPILNQVISQISRVSDTDYLRELVNYQRDNFDSQGPAVQAEWAKQTAAAEARLRQFGVTL